MAIGRGGSKTGVEVVELNRAEQREKPLPADVAASPLYGVAMLRIAMQLKKADDQPLDSLITGVLERMGLPEGDFRAYLERNGGLLKAIASKRGY